MARLAVVCEIERGKTMRFGIYRSSIMIESINTLVDKLGGSRQGRGHGRGQCRGSYGRGLQIHGRRGSKCKIISNYQNR